MAADLWRRWESNSLSDNIERFDKILTLWQRFAIDKLKDALEQWKKYNILKCILILFSYFLSVFINILYVSVIFTVQDFYQLINFFFNPSLDLLLLIFIRF
jgi:hypothetical protein